MNIRKAVDDDIPVLAEMLSRAFDKDPVESWTIRMDEKRPGALRGLFTYILNECIPHGEVTVTEGLDACALWVPPGVWTEPPSTIESILMLPTLLSWTGLRRLRRYMAMDAAEFAHRPKESHFYLATLGVDPMCRGHGLASALLEHTLSRLDELGLPAYLENSNENNMALYTRHGFRVVDVIPLSGGGPIMWSMWREPRQ